MKLFTAYVALVPLGLEGEDRPIPSATAGTRRQAQRLGAAFLNAKFPQGHGLSFQAREVPVLEVDASNFTTTRIPADQ